MPAVEPLYGTVVYPNAMRSLPTTLSSCGNPQIANIPSGGMFSSTSCIVRNRIPSRAATEVVPQIYEAQVDVPVGAARMLIDPDALPVHLSVHGFSMHGFTQSDGGSSSKM